MREDEGTVDVSHGGYGVYSEIGISRRAEQRFDIGKMCIWKPRGLLSSSTPPLCSLASLATYRHLPFLPEYPIVPLPSDHTLDFPFTIPVQHDIEWDTGLDKGELCEFCAVVYGEQSGS